MYSSRTDRKIWRTYALWTVICAVFAAVYEYFSHGVISVSMVCFPVVPLIGGLPFLLCKLNRNGICVQFWHCANASFVLGLVLKGVLEISGWEDAYSVYMLIAGGVMLIAALPGMFKKKKRK